MSKKYFFTDESQKQYPEWEQKKLGEVADYNKKTQAFDDEFFYIDLESVSDGKVTMKDKLTKESAPSRAQRILNDKDILFQNVRPYQNNHMLFKASNWDSQVVASTGFTQLTAKENLSEEYLLQIFMTKRFSDEVVIRCTGTSYPAINSSELAKIPIPVPSLPEQEKIAALFGALDERIALTADKVKLLKEQKTGYLQQVFAQEIFFTDDNGNKYPDWEQKKLGEVTSLKNGYAFDSKSYQEKGTYLVTTISNVTGDRYVDSNGSKRITTIPSDIRKHQVLSKGDILISLTGNVGRISVVNESNLLLNQRVGLIELDSDTLLNRDFLYQILSNKNFLDAMVGAGQGAAQKNIKKEDVENYVFGVPSLPEQEKIAKFFSALDEQIELTENKLSLLKEQKKGYLQGIFG